ncbi:MAG: hypothetical protein ACI4KI_08160 [Candidatus Fimenecus sp.]
MRICENGIIIEKDIEMDETMAENSAVEGTEKIDKAQALAEGLASAQTLAQVRSAAKSVLGGENE